MTGYEAVQAGAAWLDLSGRGRLQVTGEDAGRLLHAITTNDVKTLAEGDGLYAFFLTAQGRILADAQIYRRGDVFFLDTEGEIGDKLRDHIDKYIIADDAEVSVIEGWSGLSLEGASAVHQAETLELPVPMALYGTKEWKDGFVARGGVVSREGLRVFGPVATVASLRDRLSSLPPLSADEAHIVRLENGIPRYSEDLTERYLVQETRQLHGVHFNKGCYLGQEIVERVRSRAEVHRHLHSVQIRGEVPPAPGTKLLLNGKDAGEITSSAYSKRLGNVVAMAYLRTEAVRAAELTVAGTGTPAYVRQADGRDTLD